MDVATSGVSKNYAGDRDDQGHDHREKASHQEGNRDVAPVGADAAFLEDQVNNINQYHVLAKDLFVNADSS